MGQAVGETTVVEEEEEDEEDEGDQAGEGDEVDDEKAAAWK
jgi:hypothetical protein